MENSIIKRIIANYPNIQAALQMPLSCSVTSIAFNDEDYAEQGMRKVVLYSLFIASSCLGQGSSKSIEKGNSNINLTVKSDSHENRIRSGKELKIESMKEFDLKVDASISFKVGKNDSSSSTLGYFSSDHDAAIGIRGIALYQDYVYVVDTWHRSIKKINLADGKIVANKNLNVRNGFMLSDITVFNNYLYVITRDSIIYILGENLDILDSVILSPINKKLCGKEIINQTKDSLKLNSCLGSKEVMKIICIDKNNHTTYETIENNTGESNPNDEKRYVKGKSYLKDYLNGKYYFITDYGKLGLLSDIPSLKGYGAINFDFNDSTLVYFDMNSQNFKLTVIKFK